MHLHGFPRGELGNVQIQARAQMDPPSQTHPMVCLLTRHVSTVKKNSLLVSIQE
jgi:hypothetical protein